MWRIGLRPTKNSGAGWIEKEDGQSDHFICQLKSTDNRSISVKQDDLHILEQNAMTSHKLPLFAFQFLNTDEVWIAVKESDIEAIKELIKNETDYRKSIDNTTEESYNNSIIVEEEQKQDDMFDTDAVRENMRARQKYYDRIQKEKEEQAKKQKERIKAQRSAKKWKSSLGRKA